MSSAAQTYPGWLRVTAAAEYATTTTEMVYRWLREEGLRRSRVGNTIFIRREWLDEFLKNKEEPQKSSIVDFHVDRMVRRAQ